MIYAALKKIVSISVMLVFSILSFGQELLVAKGGTMTKSELLIDTVYSSNMKITGEIVFELIDSSSRHSQNIVASKFDNILKDSVEYYCLVNLTKGTLLFKKLNNRLVGQDYGKFNDEEYRKISLFLYPTCGTGIDFEPLHLNPGQVVIMRNSAVKKNIASISQPNCFIKLMTSDGAITSRPFKRNFALTDFYVEVTNAIESDHIKRQMAFAAPGD